eukprot:223544_1
MSDDDSLIQNHAPMSILQIVTENKRKDELNEVTKRTKAYVLDNRFAALKFGNGFDWVSGDKLYKIHYEWIAQKVQNGDILVLSGAKHYSFTLQRLYDGWNRANTFVATPNVQKPLPLDKMLKYFVKSMDWMDLIKRLNGQASLYGSEYQKRVLDVIDINEWHDESIKTVISATREDDKIIEDDHIINITTSQDINAFNSDDDDDDIEMLNEAEEDVEIPTIEHTTVNEAIDAVKPFVVARATLLNDKPWNGSVANEDNWRTTAFKALKTAYEASFKEEEEDEEIVDLLPFMDYPILHLAKEIILSCIKDALMYGSLVKGYKTLTSLMASILGLDHKLFVDRWLPLLYKESLDQLISDHIIKDCISGVQLKFWRSNINNRLLFAPLMGAPKKKRSNTRKNTRKKRKLPSSMSSDITLSPLKRRKTMNGSVITTNGGVDQTCIKQSLCNQSQSIASLQTEVQNLTKLIRSNVSTTGRSSFRLDPMDCIQPTDPPKLLLQTLQSTQIKGLVVDIDDAKEASVRMISSRSVATKSHAIAMDVLADALNNRAVAESIREAPMINILRPPSCKMVAVSDASSLGGGFMIGNCYSSYSFKPQHLDWHINQKEAHVILSAVYTLRKQLTGNTLL